MLKSVLSLFRRPVSTLPRQEILPPQQPVANLFAQKDRFFQRAYVSGDNFVIEQGEVLPDGDHKIVAVMRQPRSVPSLERVC